MCFRIPVFIVVAPHFGKSLTPEIMRSTEGVIGKIDHP